MRGTSPWGTRIDCVVMLTWSNWHTEPRSNRYHYAMRFARHVPVFFVQPDDGDAMEERSGEPNVTIVHVGSEYGSAQLKAFQAALHSRGLTRPLLWIYNPNYQCLGECFPGAPRVFHVTEDYFQIPRWAKEPSGEDRYHLRRWWRLLQRRLILGLQHADLVICVTPGLARTCRQTCAYSGPLLVLENGCDYRFWALGRHSAKRPQPKVVIYQGGINERLDVRLLTTVMRKLPDWEFRFCGRISPSFTDLRLLREQQNFRYLGELQPDALREALFAADVAIMPYVQVPLIKRQSLPLKAYEYVACGLPVVTVPIDAIAHQPEVFRFARSPEDFAAAIVEEARMRNDPARSARRERAARERDYDRRFAELTEALVNIQVGPRRPTWRAHVHANLVNAAARWNEFCIWAVRARQRRFRF